MKSSSNLLVGEVPVAQRAAGSKRRRRRLPDMFGQKPLWWFDLRVGGADWAFGFVSSETLALLIGKETEGWAQTLPELRWVVFDDELLDAERRDDLRRFLLHEMGHVAFDDPHVSKKLFGALTPQAMADREEAYCEAYSRMLAEPLFASRIMRLPRLPKPRGRR